MNGLYCLGEEAFSLIYGPEERAEIAALLNIGESVQLPERLLEDPGMLADVEVIMSGWGGPVLDERFLSLAPRLKAVFYGAGSVRQLVTDAFWKRNIVITSSWAANALPVAEFTEAAIVLSLKRAWALAASVRRDRSYDGKADEIMPGAYGSRVGVVSLGKIGRLVCLRLLSHDVDILAYDPLIDREYARQMGVRLCGLEELFAGCDVVTLHTPLLPETREMIGRSLLESMKPGATLINTARGGIVDEEALIEVLSRRPDLWAVLDVTSPEPPSPDSPLYRLPNVTLTPHVAGSHGAECRRMGRYAIEELRRFVSGKPLKWRVTEESVKTMA